MNDEEIKNRQTSETRQIIWERWINPMEANDEDDDIDSDDSEDNSDENETSFKGSYSESELSPIQLIKRQVLPCIITPAGFFPITDHNKPSRAFNIWILHTNFSLTKGNLFDLDNIEGIEAIQQISRYRLLITFGLMFDEDWVKKNVEQILKASMQEICEHCGSVSNNNIDVDSKEIELSDDLKNEVDLIKSQLSSFPSWAIYVMPNGVINSCTGNGDMDDHFLAQLDLYMRTYEAVGGLILKNKSD